MDGTAEPGDEDRLYGLMEVAGRQQAAVQAALDGLAAERVALAREREALARGVAGLQSGTQGAVRAEAALRRVVLWAGWRLLGWLVAVGAATVMVGWLMSSGVLWWDAGAVAAARVEKRQLQVEVEAMQANRDGWVKAGMLAKLGRCNPGNRPCVRVNEGAGVFGTASDYRVLLGY